MPQSGQRGLPPSRQPPSADPARGPSRPLQTGGGAVAANTAEAARPRSPRHPRRRLPHPPPPTSTWKVGPVPCQAVQMPQRFQPPNASTVRCSTLPA